MRLLNVDTLSFKLFYPPNIPPYVIASHRWLPDGEVMLSNFEVAREQNTAGYQKIKGFADFIKAHIESVNWLWIDTCCINQDSSSEVAEAINSMFSWYRDAAVCLAWLPDVPAVDDLSAFEKSVWFSRGWTLQELLAPSLVIFLHQDWNVIGHKGKGPNVPRDVFMSGQMLDERIAAITRIPIAILRDYTQSKDLSIDDKLRWMKGRQTTRPEDRWYCLLGILGVSMTIRYEPDGEPKAKERLFKKLRKNDSIHTPLKPSSTVPFRPDPDFIARPELTQQIQARLAEPAGRVALVGLGGVGKSQLAIEYARQMRLQSPGTWVFWIHASNTTRFDESVNDITKLLGITAVNDPQRDVLQLLSSWLHAEDNGSWVIVLDNTDDADFLLKPSTESQKHRRRIDYFPVCDHGNMIITSRSRSAAQKLVYPMDIVDVLPMRQDEAIKLFESKLKQTNGDMIQLAQALDYLPLAMTQAAAYIRERSPHCTVQRYFRMVEQSRASRSSLLQRHTSQPNRDKEASNSILLTWQISFEHVLAQKKSAADLLSLMSFCDRFAIPEILLRTTDCEDTAIEHGFEDDIATLRSFSFVSTTTDPRAWEMHRLVQDATQLWLQNRGRLDIFLNQFIYQLFSSMPTGDFENHSLCSGLYPHARNVIEQKPADRESQLEWAQVMYHSAWYAMERGDYSSALTMATLSAAVRSEQLGEDSEQASWCKAMIGLVYLGQGRWAEAETLHVQVLEASQRVLGAEHPDTLRSMNNLASSYWGQGQWAEAETLHVQVMETRQKVLGPEHPDTLMSMNNLASTYWEQGRFADAETLHVQVMEASQRVLGPEHPDTLMSMNNLASTYWGQGRWAEAETLNVQLMETSQQVLGPEHPDTLKNMDNLASTYFSQGRWAEAEMLHAQVLGTCQKVLGSEHPGTLTSMYNLALTYLGQGRWAEAETLNVQVMETREKVLGSEHPDTLRSMNNLASSYWGQGQWAEAETLHVQVMETRQKVLRSEHPDTLTSMCNLAVTHFQHNNLQEAQRLMTRCVEGQSQVLGESHPYTQASMSWLNEINSRIGHTDFLRLRPPKRVRYN